MIKKLIFCVLVVMSLSACSSNEQSNQPQPTKSPEEIAKAVSGLVEERDEVQDVSFYYAQTTEQNKGKSDFYVYFSNDNGKVSNLEFVVQYIGAHQIDTNWIEIRADDQLFSINNINDYVRGSMSLYAVQEVYSSTVYPDDLKMIRAMANAEKTIIRLTGTGLYSTDIKLSKQQKQAMLNVIRAYKNAGGDRYFLGDEL
ncbi:hypothetical protein [Paenibacillus durus]|uniref:Lipoprotein n=1 Tax=Paenibacillus durus ATCC 35681 TaxID=1333534 RepID=A0A0F7F8E3_PAEDU|nr:hypothetical protein [Paenibacillus durus]AKG33872.1 hypothetical protein VK70_04105 [Paenibacillus durus ATCC 35681]